jgi:pilus assembly protein CpaE
VLNWVTGTLNRPDVPVRLLQWQAGGRPRAPEHIVTDVVADGVNVLCIGDDVPLDVAFAVSSHIDRTHAHMSVILLAAPWPEVWREALRSGVRDVVDPNAGSRELAPALHRALGRAAHLSELRAVAARAEPPTGRVIVVLSAKGGTGKTMVASNLTVALARVCAGPVALVDLDVQFGDSASALGLMPEHTIAQLALVPDVDSTTLKVFLTPHEPSGAWVLCGAGSPEEGDNVTDKHAGRVIELLMRDFACVVVDTSAGIDELTLAALDHATDAVLVSSMDVASIRNLGKEIIALDRVGLLPDNRHFVLNRADTRVGIAVADVQAALGMRVDAAIPSSRNVPLAMNQGRPFVIDDPSSPAAREMMNLAHRFVHDGAGDGFAQTDRDHRQPPPQSTSWFRRRGR